MAIRERAGRTAVGAATLGLLIAACSGDVEPLETSAAGTHAVEESPTPTPSTAATSDATDPPERPAEMSTPSAEGAAAAASYFVSLYPYVFATGDLAEWNAMSADDCKYCLNTRASVEDQLARGVRGDGSEISVLSATGSELTAGQTYAADVEIRQSPSFEVSADGVRHPDGDGGRFKLHLALLWRDGWFVRAVDANRM